MVSHSATHSDFPYYCEECVTCLRDDQQHCPECQNPRPDNGWPSPADSPHAFLGTRINDRYVVDRFIDSGTSGHVYRARGRHFNQIVAIKVVDLGRYDESVRDQLAEQLSREIEILAQLRNPHVIDVYEALELSDDVFGLVMNFVDGRTLDQILDQHQRLEIDEAVSLLLQIANGVHEAHCRGIVHRDLKPANVIVEKLPASGHFARVLDFGIALPDEADAQGFQGTPLYASPEQCTEERPPDARSDIYGLGCLFFHLLTGQPPFPFTNALRVMDAHVEAPRPTLHDAADDVDFPAELSHLVEHMLARDPDQRPSDLGVVHRELSAFDRGESMQQLGEPPGYRDDSPPPFTDVPGQITPPPQEFVSLGERTSSEWNAEPTNAEASERSEFQPHNSVAMERSAEHGIDAWRDDAPTVTACVLDRRGLGCAIADASPAVLLVGLGGDPFTTSVDCPRLVSALEADMQRGVIIAADVRGHLLEIMPGRASTSSQFQLSLSPLSLELLPATGRVLVGAENGQIGVVDLRTESSHEILRFHHAICALHATAEHSFFTGMWDGSVARVDDGHVQWHLPVAPDAISDIGVYDDQRYFALDAQGTLHLGKLDNGELDQSFHIGPGLRTMRCLNDSRLTAVSLFDDQLQSWKISLEA